MLKTITRKERKEGIFYELAKEKEKKVKQKEA